MRRTLILAIAVLTLASFAVPAEVLAQEPPGQAVSDSRNKGQQGDAVSSSRSKGQQGDAASGGQRQGGEGGPPGTGV